MCSIPVYVTTREALQSPWVLFANFNNVSTDRVNTVLFIRLKTEIKLSVVGGKASPYFQKFVS